MAISSIRSVRPAPTPEAFIEEAGPLEREVKPRKKAEPELSGSALVQIRIPRELLRRIDREAERIKDQYEEGNRSKLIRRVMTDYLDGKLKAAEKVSR
jgi:hypothetical protein